MKASALYVALFALTGCADTHHLVRNSPPEKLLNPEASVFVAIPNDASYGRQVYSRSGEMTAHTIYAAFVKRTHSVNMARSPQSFADALESARAEKSEILAFSTILHWEDRATEWSGKRDKIDVKVEVVDVSSGKVVQSAVISGRSKWATFGGDHPQDLLPAPVDEFISSLY